MADMRKYLDTDALKALVAQIKAEDEKALAAAKKYTDEAPYDAAGSAATAESNAKAHAEEKVQELADGAVKTNTEAIATLNGADTVEGSVAKAVKDAKDALQENIDAVDGKADANAEAIAAINNAETGVLAQAKKYADDEDAKIEQSVADLGTYVGTIPTVEGEETPANIVAYIQKKTAGIATSDNLAELEGRMTQAEADIDAIEADYLKAADKTELEGKITEAKTAAENAQAHSEGVASDLADAVEELEGAIALKASQADLEAVAGVANAAVAKADYDVKVKALEDEDARIVGLVEAEVERATGVEADFEARIAEMETFWEVTEDKDGVVNKLKEIQDYIASDETGALAMAGNIQANTQAIEAHVTTVDHDFATADKTLKDDLLVEIGKKADTTVVEGLSDRMDDADEAIAVTDGKVLALEGQMTKVQGAVATKVEQEAYNTKVTALEQADAAQVGRLEALEAKFEDGEGSVADQISDAVTEALETAAADSETKANAAKDAAIAKANELNEAMSERVDELAAASATHALASDLTALDGRVTTAEGKITTLECEMDAVEGRVGVNEGAISTINTELAKKAAQADLEAAVGRIATNEGAISTLNETVADKAEQDDLNAAVARIAKNETDIAANTSAINSFVAITADEVNALFA